MKEACLEDMLANGHLIRPEVPSALRNLGRPAGCGGLYKGPELRQQRPRRVLVRVQKVPHCLLCVIGSRQVHML